MSAGKDTGHAGESTPTRERLTDRQRRALSRILRSGGMVVLGTVAARDAWADGLDEAVAVLGAHFTPEELDVIAKGAE